MSTNPFEFEGYKYHQKRYEKCPKCGEWYDTNEDHSCDIAIDETH